MRKRLLRADPAAKLQHHRHVPVVSAGVHFSGHAAGVRGTCGFLHRQGVHVGTDTDGAPGIVFGAAFAVDGGNHAGFAQTAVQGQAQCLKVGRNLVGRTVLFVAQLGVRVQIVTEVEQCPQIRGDVVGGIHQLGWLAQLRAPVTDT